MESYLLKNYARNPLLFVRGVNATLFDEQGLDYIDFTSGIGVCSVGHANKRLAQALTNQASQLIHISNLYANHHQEALAKALVELSGYDMGVFFANSGAEANECAIKVARKFGAADGRYEIITLESSFHGRTIATLKATGQPQMHQSFGPFPDGFVYARDLADIANKITHLTCAVLIELIQGEGGVYPFDKQQVQQLESLLKEKNILFMIDEVQSGIYRSGELFASQVYQITPDVITTAKGLGGGIPIGALLTSQKDIFSAGDHGSTFGGNFLSSRAALEVLEILSELKDSKQLDQSIHFFATNLKQIATDYPHLFIQELGIGLMRGLQVKNDALLQAIVQKAHDKRLLILKSGKNTLRFLPPLTISLEEMVEGFGRLRLALDQIQGEA